MCTYIIKLSIQWALARNVAYESGRRDLFDTGFVLIIKWPKCLPNIDTSLTRNGFQNELILIKIYLRTFHPIEGEPFAELVPENGEHTFWVALEVVEDTLKSRTEVK